MKTCTICKLDKHTDEFNLKASTKDGRQNLCRPCSKAKSKEYYAAHNSRLKIQSNAKHQARRKLLNATVKKIKQHNGCCVCGESTICCIDFHHMNGKEFSISAHGGNVSAKKLLTEISKCSCLCANCHRKLHNGLLGDAVIKMCVIPDLPELKGMSTRSPRQ